MFQEPRYLQSSFNLIFSRKSDIRRDVFRFEENLKDLYNQPQVIGIPDDIHPETPRMIFTSKPTSNNISSQILISQVSFSLNINYSDDNQYYEANSKGYVLSQVSKLFVLYNSIEEREQPYFCGFSTSVQIPAQKELEEEVVSQIYNLLSIGDNNFYSNSDIYEIQLKISNVVKNKFFSNLSIQSYRSWQPDSLIPSTGIIPRLPKSEISESGIQIMVDCNDRYAFNENASYFCEESQAQEIMELGFNQVSDVVEKIKRS